MISGSLLLVVIFVIIFLVATVFAFCHWYGGDSIQYVGLAFKKDSLNLGNPKVFKKQCSCSESFKGLCEECESPEFVNDGELGKMPDFRSYGGNLGLDGMGSGATAKVDPTRSFMGKGMNPWNGPAHGTIKQDHFV